MRSESRRKGLRVVGARVCVFAHTRRVRPRVQLGDAGAEASHQTPQRATERAGQGAAGSGAGARVPDHAPECACGAAQTVAGGGDQLAGGGARHHANRRAEVDVLAVAVELWSSGIFPFFVRDGIVCLGSSNSNSRCASFGDAFRHANGSEELGERAPREIG